MKDPVTISVLIPVYNREKYISDSVKSILQQTRQDFELIVIDDGSTDKTADVVEAYNDPRIRLVRHEKNKGISGARNTGLDHVRGQFIAWLDSDDFALPNRLTEQVSYLETNPEIAMVGSCAGLRGKDGERISGYRIPPILKDDVRAWLLFRSAFQQSSIFGRTEILTKYRYREDLPVCADVDVNIRISQSHQICNMNRLLIERRVHPDQMVKMNKSSIKLKNMELFREQLQRYGIDGSEEDFKRHAILASFLKHWDKSPDESFLEWAENWLIKLKESKTLNNQFLQQSLDFATCYFWAKACVFSASSTGRSRVIKKFFQSPLSKYMISGHARRWLFTVLLIWISDHISSRYPKNHE